MKKVVLIVTAAIMVLFMLASCGKITVTWLDGDGKALFTEQIKSDEPIPEKALPENNDEWDYIEWQISENDGNITYTAVREARDRYEWRDVDGTVLHKESVKGGDKKPEFELPGDRSDFDYTEWTASEENGVKVFTAFGYSGKTVLWRDVDKTVLYTVFVRDGETVPDRYLPNDTLDWHYTNWKEAEDGFVAERIAKQRVYWLDVDGKELYVDGFAPGQEMKLRELPKDSKKWIYKEWKDITEENGEKTYIAVAEMNPVYFKGNVFQIVTKDLYGNVLALGSGFIFNKQGWFITNYHVMDGAVSAEAIFEIEDYLTGDSYTTLSISHAYHGSEQKDIFIGKIEDYKKISSHYQNIPLVRNYSVGETVYTVGYPSASIKMEIHSGEIVDESEKKVNTLYNKLVSGSTYIPSTAYCAPGSSGGILINEKLEVVGMVTGGLEENKKFVLGAAIRTFNFLNTANNVNTKNAKGFVEYMYPDTANNIKLFMLGATHENCVGIYKDTVGVYYQYIFTNKYNSSEEATVINVYDNGNIIATRTQMWSSGSICTSILAGVYTGEASCIDSFEFLLVCSLPSGNGFKAFSDNINYSSDINKTLKEYQTEPIGNMSINSDNIEVIKQQFNGVYKSLDNLFKQVK